MKAITQAEAIVREMAQDNISAHIDRGSIIHQKDETWIELWFSKISSANRAVDWLRAKGIENGGRESISKSINVYFKFSVEIYLKNG